jgi:hypothetical protein
LPRSTTGGPWDEGLSVADEFLADAEAGSGTSRRATAAPFVRGSVSPGELEDALEDSRRARSGQGLERAADGVSGAGCSREAALLLRVRPTRRSTRRRAPRDVGNEVECLPASAWAVELAQP